jgi:leucyl aminopeptidase
MKISPTDIKVAEMEADAVVVGIDSEGELTKEAGELALATNGVLPRLAQAKEISGKLGDVTLLHALPGVRTGLVAVVGLGESQRFGRGEAFRAAAAAAKRLAEKARQRVAFFLGDGWTEQQVESGICGAMVGCQGQDIYRAEKNTHPFEEMLWARR